MATKYASQSPINSSKTILITAHLLIHSHARHHRHPHHHLGRRRLIRCWWLAWSNRCWGGSENYLHAQKSANLPIKRRILTAFILTSVSYYHQDYVFFLLQLFPMKSYLLTMMMSRMTLLVLHDDAIGKWLGGGPHCGRLMSQWSKEGEGGAQENCQ